LGRVERRGLKYGMRTKIQRSECWSGIDCRVGSMASGSSTLMSAADMLSVVGVVRSWRDGRVSGLAWSDLVWPGLIRDGGQRGSEDNETRSTRALTPWPFLFRPQSAKSKSKEESTMSLFACWILHSVSHGWRRELGGEKKLMKLITLCTRVHIIL